MLDVRGLQKTAKTYPPDAHTPVVKLVLRLAEETLQAGHGTTC